LKLPKKPLSFPFKIWRNPRDFLQVLEIRLLSAEPNSSPLRHIMQRWLLLLQRCLVALLLVGAFAIGLLLPLAKSSRRSR
jgi:hypothetical protein